MKKLHATGMAAFLSALATSAVLAGTPPESWYVAPEILGVWTDNDRIADDGFGFAISVGKVLSDKWDVELSVFNSSHDSLGNTDLDLRGALLNLHRVFYRESRVTPFLKLGVGWLQDDYSAGETDDSAVGVYGVGFLADLYKQPEQGTNLQLRGELYGRTTFEKSDVTDDRLDDFVAGLGLQYSWGAPIPRAEPPPPPPPPPPPGDEDKDGVTDDLDKCPGTFPGAAVDANGCELDSDGDGVVDRLDRCPGTPRGDKVDEYGCSLRGRLEVFFDNDKATLKPESNRAIDALAKFMTEVPRVTGTIEGHTDSNGSEAHNQRLSERRANAVRDALVERGISPTRLSVKGLGESQPEADNATAEGRAQNRRVLFVRSDKVQLNQ